MFLFGKKKEKKEKNIEVNIKVNKDELIAEASEKIQELEGLSGEQRVPLLNQIGALYYQAEELESAIKYYEESLSIKKEMGKSYTDLMSLYNKKRQQAEDGRISGVFAPWKSISKNQRWYFEGRIQRK